MKTTSKAKYFLIAALLFAAISSMGRAQKLPKGGASLPAGIYEGIVTFIFPDETKLVSDRTIEVTGDQTAIMLTCSEYYEKKKSKTFASKVLLKGKAAGRTFYSLDQQCIRTDYKQWVPETMKIEFSTDGATAVFTSTYENEEGRVDGSGLLVRKAAR